VSLLTNEAGIRQLDFHADDAGDHIAQWELLSIPLIVATVGAILARRRRSESQQS
jgi:hypothetical protein